MLDSWIHSDYKQVDKRDPLHRMQGYMDGTTKTRPIICDGKKPFGVPNRKALMRTRLLPEARIDKFAQPVPVLLADEDPLRAMEAFAQNQVDYLPVTRDGKLAGYVEAMDILDVYEEGPIARQAATRLEPLHEDTPMHQALRLFRTKEPDHVPVVDANGRLSGVLHRNMALRLESQTPHPMRQAEAVPDQHDLTDDPVKHYMSRDYVEAAPDAPFAEMKDLLRKHDHVFVPEMRGSARKPSFGVVSPASMVRACHRHLNEPNGVLSPTGDEMSSNLRPNGPKRSPDYGHNPSS